MEKKILCVTGAASGIGFATAVKFAKEGYFVIACDRSQEGLEKLRNEINDDQNLETVVFDMLDMSSFSNIEAAIKKHGKLDCLVNSAGITSLTQLNEITVEEWDRIFNINLKGTFFLTRQLLPYLEKGTDPNIVNMCSVAGIRGGKFSNFAYSCSKGGVSILTKDFAQLLAPKKIRCNQVAPDVVKTNMVTSKATPEFIANAEKGVPLGHFSEASDIAEGIYYLASPAARYITGMTLHINGGTFIA